MAGERRVRRWMTEALAVEQRAHHRLARGSALAPPAASCCTSSRASSRFSPRATSAPQSSRSGAGGIGKRVARKLAFEELLKAEPSSERPRIGHLLDQRLHAPAPRGGEATSREGPIPARQLRRFLHHVQAAYSLTTHSIRRSRCCTALPPPRRHRPRRPSALAASSRHPPCRRSARRLRRARRRPLRASQAPRCRPRGRARAPRRVETHRPKHHLRCSWCVQRPGARSVAGA